jgi:hypothetical protein
MFEIKRCGQVFNNPAHFFVITCKMPKIGLFLMGFEDHK